MGNLKQVYDHWRDWKIQNYWVKLEWVVPSKFNTKTIILHVYTQIILKILLFENRFHIK